MNQQTIRVSELDACPKCPALKGEFCRDSGIHTERIMTHLGVAEYSVMLTARCDACSPAPCSCTGLQ